MLRVAFVGKGGSGKSSIAGTFARLLGQQDEPVIVLDSDPMPGLAVSLGIEPSDAGLPDEAVVEGGEGGPRFRLRDDLTPFEAVERYARQAPDGVRLVQLGKLHGHAGALVRSQFAFRGIAEGLDDDAHVVGDLPGGTRQPFFGWGSYATTYLVVTEPTAKSILAARRLRNLASGERPVRLLAVASKVTEATDAGAIAERTGLEVVAAIPWDEKLRAAERDGRAPLDAAPGSEAVRAIASLVDRMRRETT